MVIGIVAFSDCQIWYLNFSINEDYTEECTEETNENYTFQFGVETLAAACYQHTNVKFCLNAQHQ